MSTVDLIGYEWNVGPSPDAQIESRVDQLLKDEGVLILNEMGGRNALVDRLRKKYGVLTGTERDQKRVVLVWTRERFVQEQGAIERVGEWTRVGKAGAGPVAVDAKHMPTVLLRDLRTGRRFRLAGKHLVASQYIAVRKAMAVLDIARTLAWVLGHRGMLLMGADWNMKPNSPLIKPLLVAGGLRSVPLELGAKATHGNRAIDWFLYRASKYWVLVDQWVVPMNEDDHDAIGIRMRVTVKAKVKPALKPDFWGVTWNVFNQTPVPELEKILKKLLAKGVTIFLIQEADKPEFREMLKRNGLELFFHPQQYVVAWVPLDKATGIGWTEVDHEGLDLASTTYFPEGGGSPRRTKAASVTLRNGYGWVLEALSYHTAAFVQVPEGKRPVRRFQSLKEAMATLSKRKMQGAVVKLYGGDDNVDESGAFAAAFTFMLEAATGLKQVVAPSPTHGHKVNGRKIDDFRTFGLDALDGEVGDGGGDHRYHLRGFRFKRRFRRPDFFRVRKQS